MTARMSEKEEADRGNGKKRRMRAKSSTNEPREER